MSSGTEVTNVWCSLRFSRFISSGPTVLDSLRSLSKPHRGKARALLQDALHVLAVVLVGFVEAFGGIQVGVARDADDVGALDGVHGEDLGRHHLDGVFQQDELQAAARQLDDALALAGQGDQPQRHAFRPQVLRGLGLLGGRLFGLALVLVGLGVGRVLAALRGLALALGAACRAGARVRAAGGVGFLVQHAPPGTARRFPNGGRGGGR